MFVDGLQKKFGVENPGQIHIKDALPLLEDEHVWQSFDTLNQVKLWLDGFDLSYKGRYDYINRYRPDLVGTDRQVSFPHHKMATWIRETYPQLELIINDRQQIKPYELDIFFPEKMKAIEIDGAYWHQGREEYHKMKDGLAQSKGIAVSHFTDIEIQKGWTSVQSSVRSFIEG